MFASLAAVEHTLLSYLLERGQIPLDFRILRLQLGQRFDMRQRGGKILGLDLVGGQRRKTVAIIGLARKGAFQNIDRRLGLAGVVQRDGVDIGEARLVRRQTRRLPQAYQRVGEAFLPDEAQPQCVGDLARFRIGGLRLLQNRLRAGLIAGPARHFGQRNRRRGKSRIDFDRLGIGAARLLILAPLQIKRAEIGLRFRPLGVEKLSRNIFSQRLVESRAVVRRKTLLGLARQRAGGVHAHQPRLCAQQGRQYFAF